MDVLVPVDGSDCSERALRFAAEFARRYGGTLTVVHFSDSRGEATEALVERVEGVLDDEGVRAASIDVVVNVRVLGLRASDRVGDAVLDYAAEHDTDHVVVGHHGTGAVGKLLLGSVAETLAGAGAVPVTVVP